MNLRILRPADGIMMKLVKYNLIDEISGGDNTGNTVDLPHNHNLREETSSDADLKPNK